MTELPRESRISSRERSSIRSLGRIPPGDLGVLEFAVFVLLVGSLVRLEFLPHRDKAIMQVGLAVAMLAFACLAFGQTATNQFSGTASLYTYFGSTAMILILVSLMPPNRSDRWLGRPQGRLTEQRHRRLLDLALRDEDEPRGVAERHERVLACDPGDAAVESRVDELGDHTLGHAAGSPRLVDHEHAARCVAARRTSATGSGASHRRSSTRARIPCAASGERL